MSIKITNFDEVATGLREMVRQDIAAKLSANGVRFNEADLDELVTDLLIYLVSRHVALKHQPQTVADEYRGHQHLEVKANSPEAAALFGRIPATVGTQKLGYSESTPNKIPIERVEDLWKWR